MANYIAALDITTGAALPWDPLANRDVFSIAANGSRVYVGGKFTSIGYGADHQFFGQFDDISPTALKPQARPKPSAFSNSGNKQIFKYVLSSPERVSIRLYDLQGHIKSTPLNAEQGAGNHTVVLPTKGIAPGSYIAILQAGKKLLERKMILIP